MNSLTIFVKRANAESVKPVSLSAEKVNRLMEVLGPYIGWQSRIETVVYNAPGDEPASQPATPKEPDVESQEVV